MQIELLGMGVMYKGGAASEKDEPNQGYAKALEESILDLVNKLKEK